MLFLNLVVFIELKPYKILQNKISSYRITLESLSDCLSIIQVNFALERVGIKP